VVVWFRTSESVVEGKEYISDVAVRSSYGSAHYESGLFRIWRRSGVQLLRSAKAPHLTKVTRISITLKTYTVEPMACNGVYPVLTIGLV
jgi:hypothetical protein